MPMGVSASQASQHAPAHHPLVPQQHHSDKSSKGAAVKQMHEEAKVAHQAQEEESPKSQHGAVQPPFGTAG